MMLLQTNVQLFQLVTGFVKDCIRIHCHQVYQLQVEDSVSYFKQASYFLQLLLPQEIRKKPQYTETDHRKTSSLFQQKYKS